MGKRIFAIFVFLGGIALAVFLGIGGCAANEVKTVDLSAIKWAEQLLVGTNDKLRPDFECSPMAFAVKQYDLVMVGENYGTLVYLGRAEGQWYRTGESLHLNFVQEAKEVKLDGVTLVIVCGKTMGPLVFCSIVAAVFIFVGGICAFHPKSTSY